MGDRIERFKNWIGTDSVPFQSPLARMSDRLDDVRERREQKGDDDKQEGSEEDQSEQDEGSSA